MSKARELKIRIPDMSAFMSRLELLGARRGAHLHVFNVYFHQPSGGVLKLSRDETGDFLVRLQASDDGFDLMSNEPIVDFEETRRRLGVQFGEKSTLEKEEIYFSVPGRSYVLDVTVIAGVGNFVVIQDDDPGLVVATDDLGIEEPEVITVPFDEVPPLAS